MTEEARRRDRIIAVCGLAVALFNPPLLDLFSGGTVLGWPLLYVYLFTAWAAVIAILALVIERRRGTADSAEDED